jgi:hypothetical protein
MKPSVESLCLCATEQEHADPCAHRFNKQIRTVMQHQHQYITTKCRAMHAHCIGIDSNKFATCKCAAHTYPTLRSKDQSRYILVTYAEQRVRCALKCRATPHHIAIDARSNKCGTLSVFLNFSHALTHSPFSTALLKCLAPLLTTIRDSIEVFGLSLDQLRSAPGLIGVLVSDGLSKLANGHLAVEGRKHRLKSPLEI